MPLQLHVEKRRLHVEKRRHWWLTLFEGRRGDGALPDEACPQYTRVSKGRWGHFAPRLLDASLGALCLWGLVK